ncbi:MAG: hypothetical protein AB7U20_03725 [Planctomycetaceae bacterium]
MSIRVFILAVPGVSGRIVVILSHFAGMWCIGRLGIMRRLFGGAAGNSDRDDDRSRSAQPSYNVGKVHR